MPRRSVRSFAASVAVVTALSACGPARAPTRGGPVVVAIELGPAPSRAGILRVTTVSGFERPVRTERLLDARSGLHPLADLADLGAFADGGPSHAALHVLPGAPVTCATPPPGGIPLAHRSEAGFCFVGGSDRAEGRGSFGAVRVHTPTPLAAAPLLPWATRSLASVAAVFGGPLAGGTPIELFVVPRRGPSRGDDGFPVVFGEVHSLASASIALYLSGDGRAPPADDDWVLPHELVHFVMPSLPADGRALMEGVATYFEPQIRCGAGNDAAGFPALLRTNLRRGNAALAAPPGTVADPFLATYWGGAALVAAMDAALRTAPHPTTLRAAIRADHQAGHDARTLEETDVVLRRWGAGTGIDLVAMYHRWAPPPVGASTAGPGALPERLFLEPLGLGEVPPAPGTAAAAARASLCLRRGSL